MRCCQIPIIPSSFRRHSWPTMVNFLLSSASSEAAINW
ncbi:hypothetical protein M6B38_325625 [Iris pallida]|uniref:Uncharacterized protein n=1 Tax=Iris pallida TaxID=29817 RepID=A0AAX6H7U5_IRIPA|nr:hypothetical protein M6B38_325625 [Iris pallida]